MFDRKVFFTEIRESLFKGQFSQQQVDGLNFKLDVWEAKPYSDDLRWLSYALATSYWETARTCWPIEEYGKGKGRRYGSPDKETGQAYYGRGDVQLTWKENYQKMTPIVRAFYPNDEIDLVWHPEQALHPSYSACIMYEGMTRGSFTGKELDDYFTETKNDPIRARAIINADVTKNGAKIADIHELFLDALTASLVTGPLPIEPEPIPGFGTVDIQLSTSSGVVVSITLNGTLVLASKAG